MDRRRAALLFATSVAVVGLAAWIVGHGGNPPAAVDRGVDADGRAGVPSAPMLVGRTGPQDAKTLQGGAPEIPASVRALGTGSLRVTVEHESKRLGGATVTLRSEGGWVRETATNAEGIAVFPDVPAGKTIVEGTASGPLWDRSEIEVWAGHEMRLDLALEPGEQLTGRVLDARDDRPLARAEACLVLGWDAWIASRTGPCAPPTGEDGRFRLTWGSKGLPWGRPYVAVRALGHELAMVEVPTSTDREKGAVLTIRLEPGGAARGTVRSRDGAPVAGAAVFFVAEEDASARTEPLGYIPWESTSPRALVGRTDEDGRYAIEGLAFAAGYAALAMTPDSARAIDVTGLVVTAERPVVTADLVVPKPATLVLHVVGENRTVVPDFVTEIDGRRVTGDTTDGTRVVRNLAPGTYDVGARGEGFLWQSLVVDVAEGARVEREVVLHRKNSISGVVVDEHGKLSERGWVREDLPPDRSSFHPVRDGRFQFSEVSAGGHRLTPTDEWRVPIGKPTLVEAPTNDARLRTTGRQIGRLRLRAPAGFDVPQAMRVEWSDDGRSRGTRSRGEDGEFRFGLMSGRRRLRFAPTGFLAFERDVDAPVGQDVDLGEVTLDPGAVLAGRVVDRRGHPIEAAEVSVEERDPWSYSEARTAVDGSFRLTGLRPDAVTVAASAAGYFPALVESARAGGGAPLTIVLDAGGTIRGRLLDPLGRGVDMQDLFVIGANGDDDDLPETVSTDPKGRFALRSPSGHRMLALLHRADWRRVTIATVDVEEGKETVVDVLYPPR